MDKFTAASINLNTAIRLYFEGNYISCVTLAGAARVVYDNLLEAQESGANAIAFFAKHSGLLEVKIVNALHNAYNWTKHAKDDPTLELEVSKKDCEILLVAAIPSFFRLGGIPSPDIKEFTFHLPEILERWDASYADGPQ